MSFSYNSSMMFIVGEEMAGLAVNITTITWVKVFSINTEFSINWEDFSPMHWYRKTLVFSIGKMFFQ